MAERILRIYLDNCCYNRPYDRRVLKYPNDKIEIMNPIDFLKVLEVTENVQHD